MKISLILFLISIFLVNLTAQHFQLASPILHFDEILFEESMKVSAELRMEGVVLRYSLDNSEVDERSSILESPLLLKEDCIFKVKAFHPEYRPSSDAVQGFRKIESHKEIKKIDLLTEIHPSYKGKGSLTLHDLKKGSSNFQDAKWLGFKGQDVEIEVDLAESTRNVEVMVGLLTNPGSWIFGPEKILLYIEDKENGGWEEVASLSCELLKEGAAPFNDFLNINASFKKDTKKIRLKLMQFKETQNWHPGTPEDTWIFVDEIIIK